MISWTIICIFLWILVWPMPKILIASCRVIYDRIQRILLWEITLHIYHWIYLCISKEIFQPYGHLMIIRNEWNKMLIMQRCFYSITFPTFCFQSVSVSSTNWRCERNFHLFIFVSIQANRLMARIYNNASLWLTTIAAGSSTTLASMSLCNREVRSLVCLNPSIGTYSINFCVTSYSDEIRLAVSCDSTLVPNPEFFTECFIQQVGDENECFRFSCSL